MAMQTAKRGLKDSPVRIKISPKTKTISFSSGFMHQYNYSQDNAKFIRLGYDPETRQIGIELLAKAGKSDDLFKLQYTSNRSSASAPISALLRTFNLPLNKIAGTYETKAIEGLTQIDGFAEQGFLLKLSARVFKLSARVKLDQRERQLKKTA